jgi:hydrogenase maturation factor
MATASNVGFKIDFDKIPIAREAHTFQETFQLSLTELLSMSSTGTILAAIHPVTQDRLKQLRQTRIKTKIIGSFTKNNERILIKEGEELPFPKNAIDPYVTILSSQL